MRAVRRFGLSKSRITYGLQCGKRLWLQVHRPALAVYPAETQRRFAAGHDVNDVARALRPGGVLVEWQDDLERAVRETAGLLAGPGDVTVLEPAFRHRGVFVRADILERRAGRYRMTEVKSATRLKEYHLTDVAVQTWVIEGSGLSLDILAVDVVDPAFVYPGGGDYHGLFRTVPVADQVRPLLARIPGWVDGFVQLLDGPQPAIGTGPQCHRPFDCPFITFCREQEGRRPGESAPCERPAPAAPDPALGCVDPAAAAYLASLPYPRFYLDFETVQFAVPVWEGTRPFEQLLFQWSCHTESEAGEITHAAYLDTAGSDPTRGAAEALLTALGDRGPVFVYTDFEKWRLVELAARYPDLAASLEAATGRLVDLFRLAREHYTHPALNGSYSLKSVLPAVTGELGHALLDEVQDGLSAQAAFHEAIDSATDAARREDLRRALLEYCALDTEALVRLAHALECRRAPSQPEKGSAG
jgi:hypothetical protein